MIKRITSTLFILLATIALLAPVVIPHHHHDDVICYTRSHCQTDCGDYVHQDTEKKHEHDGNKSSENCVLKQVVVVTSNRIEPEYKFQYTDDNQTLFDGLQGLLPEKTLENIFSRVLSNTQLLLFSSTYSYFTRTCIGLRAPPVV